MPITVPFHRALACAGVIAALAMPAAADTVYVQAGKVLAIAGEAPRGPTTIIITDGKIVSLEAG